MTSTPSGSALDDASKCPACGALPLKSLWGRADPDLRLCPRCGDWFVFGNERLTHLERPAALVAEELLSGTTRPHEVIDQAMALVDAPVFAAVVDHLSDDGLAPVLERLVALLPTTGDVGTAVMQRLEVAARSSRFAGQLKTLLAAAPVSKRTLRLLTVCEGVPGPKPLPADELADFWALGISLEAEWVSDDEWRRAIRETRAQEVSSYSSMGTAETGWVRVTSLAASKDGGAVVPPGKTAEHTDPTDIADDRDIIQVCWAWFWLGQVLAALKHVTPTQRRYVFGECVRQLRELQRGWPPNAADAWFSEDALPTDALERELSAPDPTNKVKSRRARLVSGLRRAWLKGDLSAAVDLVLIAAAGPERRWDREGDLTRQGEVRMELLRFIVRLVRG